MSLGRRLITNGLLLAGRDSDPRAIIKNIFTSVKLNCRGREMPQPLAWRYGDPAATTALPKLVWRNSNISFS